MYRLLRNDKCNHHDSSQDFIIIQIHCYNEEHYLPIVLKTLPRNIKDTLPIRWLVVDDGSTDRTCHVAMENGVDYVIKLNKHLGLSTAFNIGIKECIKLGASAIITTDADNQYESEDIVKLYYTLINQDADIVIGERPISNIASFGTVKKILQRLGSWLVRTAK